MVKILLEQLSEIVAKGCKHTKQIYVVKSIGLLIKKLNLILINQQIVSIQHVTADDKVYIRPCEIQAMLEVIVKKYTHFQLEYKRCLSIAIFPMNGIYIFLININFFKIIRQQIKQLLSFKWTANILVVKNCDSLHTFGGEWC